MHGRIHILVGGHLSTAPRAQKEALALMEAGYDVRVTGVWFDMGAVARDERLMAETGIDFRAALDFRPGSIRAAARRARVRLGARWAREGFLRTGKFSPGLLGYGGQELLAAARRERADLTIVHSEAGLWTGMELARQGERVGLDFEDWFSRDLPPHARRGRPVDAIGELERQLARQAQYVIAPSEVMSQTLAAAYGISPPTVVYNAFPWADRAAMDGRRVDRSASEVPSLHWFSQTIGPDRGLELLFAALACLENRTEIYLRGACSASVRRWLDKQIPVGWRGAVKVLPGVPNAELLSRIAEHDIGLALESAEIPSRDLSVSNKLFQYLQAGLAVIATGTQGQREVLTRCGEAGCILSEPAPRALAQSIDGLLAEPERLARARRAALEAAAGIFSWERHKGRIVEQAARALAAA